jgi:hypothetical protein
MYASTGMWIVIGGDVHWWITENVKVLLNRPGLLLFSDDAYGEYSQ